MEDKREIRKNITILALDNLIQNYTNALEDKDMDPPLSNEERELSELIIKEAKEMLTEMAIENKPIIKNTFYLIALFFSFPDDLFRAVFRIAVYYRIYIKIIIRQ